MACVASTSHPSLKTICHVGAKGLLMKNKGKMHYVMCIHYPLLKRLPLYLKDYLYSKKNIFLMFSLSENLKSVFVPVVSVNGHKMGGRAPSLSPVFKRQAKLMSGKWAEFKIKAP